MADAMRKPRWYNYWGWGSGDMLGAGAQAVITGWLFYFFTTFCGLTPVEAGLILGLPRLIEAITCPLIGYISDNLRHTWIGRKVGRRKIFLLLTIPLLPSFVLIFMTGQTFTYYLLTFIFFEFLYTMFLIPWETLAAEMTKDYKEKAKVAGARMIVAQSSAILASYLPTLIIDRLGKDSPDTFMIMAAIFGGLFSLVVLLVVIFTWERPYTDAEKLVQPEPMSGAKLAMIPVNMFRDLFSTLRIRAFRQHLSIYLGGYISQDIANTALPIFVVTVMLGATAIISQLMTVMYLFQLISVVLAINIVIKTGPTLAYRIAISFFTAGLLLFLIFYFTKPDGVVENMGLASANIFATLNPLPHDIVLSTPWGPWTVVPVSPVGFNPTLIFWLFVPILVCGLGRGTLNFVPWSVYNYLPDVDEAVTGQRREGIFAGVMTLVRKLAQAGAIIVTGWIIDLGGYVAPEPGQSPLSIIQTPEAISTITWLFVAGPIVVMLLGLIVSWSFRLNAGTHAVLIHEVERLRSGETQPESEESREIVENLTGWKYDRLWGRNRVGDVPNATPGLPPSPEL